MVVAIKYCGGCNEYYNRKESVSYIKSQLKHHVFTSYEPEKIYDMVLVVCGCPSECIHVDTENSVYLSCAEDVEKTVETLKTL